jgi:hypothetical protein
VRIPSNFLIIGEGTHARVGRFDTSRRICTKVRFVENIGDIRGVLGRGWVSSTMHCLLVQWMNTVRYYDLLYRYFSELSGPPLDLLQCILCLLCMSFIVIEMQWDSDIITSLRSISMKRPCPWVGCVMIIQNARLTNSKHSSIVSALEVPNSIQLVICVHILHSQSPSPFLKHCPTLPALTMSAA